MSRAVPSSRDIKPEAFHGELVRIPRCTGIDNQIFLTGKFVLHCLTCINKSLFLLESSSRPCLEEDCEKCLVYCSKGPSICDRVNAYLHDELAYFEKSMLLLGESSSEQICKIATDQFSGLNRCRPGFIQPVNYDYQRRNIGLKTRDTPHN